MGRRELHRQRGGPNGKPIPLAGKLGDNGAIETKLGDGTFTGAVYPGPAASASGR